MMDRSATEQELIELKESYEYHRSAIEQELIELKESYEHHRDEVKYHKDLMDHYKEEIKKLVSSLTTKNDDL